jgi:hypothetical protein
MVPTGFDRRREFAPIAAHSLGVARGTHVAHFIGGL